MKQFALLFALMFLFSCGVKVPFTNEIREEFNLTTADKLKKVQFYTSATIIMEKSKTSGGQITADDGALVTSSSKEKDRIIIPINTKCVFDNFGPNNEIIVRFEVGSGRTIAFAIRPNQTANAKYYLVAEWVQERGGKLSYANETYYATPTSGITHLMVKLKNLEKTKKKDRVVKGMKV